MDKARWRRRARGASSAPIVLQLLVRKPSNARKKNTEKFHVIAGVLVTPYKFDPRAIIVVLELAAERIDRISRFHFKFVDFELKFFTKNPVDAKNSIYFATVVFVAGCRDMRKALVDRVADARSGK
jgi:hypothetical protein